MDKPIDEAVEAACRAFFADWKDTPSEGKENLRTLMAAALTAAQQQGQAQGGGEVIQRHVVTKYRDGSVHVADVAAPPSAPVGVDLVELGRLLVREREAVGGAFTPDWLLFREALAQQPAAVDGARAMELWDEFREAGHHERDALICVLQALATQHQEPTT